MQVQFLCSAYFVLGFFGGGENPKQDLGFGSHGFPFLKKTLNPKMDLLFIATVMFVFLHRWSVLSYVIQCGYFRCAVFFWTSFVMKN